MEYIKCTKCSSDMVILVDCKRGHNICYNCMVIGCPLCQSKLSNPVVLELEEIIRELDAVVLKLTELRQRASIFESENQIETDVVDEIPKEQVKETDIHVESIKGQKETAIKDVRYAEQKKAYVKNGSLEEKKETDHKIKKSEEEMEADIKDSEFTCEGAQFCNWKCKWKGNYDHVLKHFQHSHKQNVLMQSQPFLKTKIDTNRSSSTLSLIRLEINGEERLFWYKQKIDLKKEMVYFVIQYPGPKKEANKYFYEFTAFNNSLDILKIRQMCESSDENVNVIIDEGRCGIIPFNIVNNYIHDMQIAFICKIDLIKLEIERATCNMISSQTKSDIEEGTEKPFTPVSSVEEPIQGIYVCESEYNDNDVVNFEAMIRMSYNFTENYTSDHTFYPGKKEAQKQFIFKCRNDMKRRNTCFLVQCFEEESKASNYLYEIKIPLDPLKSFKTQNTCRSLCEKESKIINGDGCVTFPFNITKSCLNDYGQIVFSIVIKERNCSKARLDHGTNPASYAFIMTECLEFQRSNVELPYMFSVGINEYNFPNSKLESDLISALNIAENIPKLFNPIYFNYVDVSDKGGCVDLVIVTKVTINFQTNCFHEGCLRLDRKHKEECFFVKAYHDTKSRMMHWVVVYKGAKNQALGFFYQLSIYRKPSNFFKVRKACGSSWESDHKYIEEGKCVSLPFESIKNFMNKKNEIFCIIRIKERSRLNAVCVFT